jgi:malonyl-CoA O-methyltransferase
MDLDRAQVRRAFERAAATYDEAAVLQREVGQRMAERLGFVRMQPVTILDAGCGTGAALGELHARYPDARLIGLDLAFNMTLAARDRAAAAAGPPSRARTRPRPAAPARELRPQVYLRRYRFAADQPASIDLIWSNLSLQWVGDPKSHSPIPARVLRVGACCRSPLSAPTRWELRAAFLAADRASHVGRFIDMHDLGDMLVHAGCRPGHGHGIAAPLRRCYRSDARSESDRGTQCYQGRPRDDSPTAGALLAALKPPAARGACRRA